MRYYLKFILLLLACWFTTNVVFAQQETLEEKKELAGKFFEDKDWAPAEALYGSIITDSPKDHDLNFRYGTCLLYASKNKEAAIKRLRYAVTGSNIDKRAYYYLARAYHLNYQFNDAIKFYLKFQKLGSAKDLEKLNVEADLKSCNFGKKLLADITDLIVIKKTELDADRFYDLYKLDDIDGTIIVTSEFQSKLDKKRDHRPVIHSSSKSKAIYYSSFGNDGETGLDIYVKRKLPGGEWALPQKVRGQVNTDLDEDYAYMHPNGEYLYFCSKGHNTMGGYDVFRSKYNSDSQSFLKPENMDFAISSPDDDLLFVVDSLNRLAYFASSRESGQNKLMVYQVRMDRIPMQMAVIKGNFLNTINADQKEVEIEIEDFSSGRIIGSFTSKRTNGDYLLTFPKSGKYRFIITPKGSDISHTYLCTIPASKEFKPLKQSMTLDLDSDGEDRISVKDLFDEEFDDPVAVMAEVYRELSKLPPNAEEFNLDSLDALQSNDDIFLDAGLDVYITEYGLETMLTEKEEDLTRAKFEDQEEANIAYHVGVEKIDLANEKMVELNELVAEAEQEEDPNTKTRILEQVLSLKNEVESLNNESQSLLELAEKIEMNILERDLVMNETKAVLKELDGIKGENKEVLAQLIGQNMDYFTKNVKGNPPITNTVDNALKEGVEEQKRVQEISDEITGLSKTKRDLMAKNTTLERKLAQEKKKKEIAAIEALIEENNSEIIVLQSAIKEKNDGLADILSESTAVRNGVAAAIVLKDDYSDSDYEKYLSISEKRDIKQKINGNALEKNLAMVDKVLEENNISAFNIDLYANDETTSQYTLEKWNTEIDEVAKQLRQEKLAATKERQVQIQKELDRLEQFRTEKIAEFQTGNVDPTTIRPDIEKEDVVKDYERRTESIAEIVSEGDRKKATVALNSELLDGLEKERRRLDNILADNPKAKNIKTRLENLEVLENSIRKQIDNDNDWIAKNESENSFNPEDVLSSIEPNYQRKVNEAFQLSENDDRKAAITDLNQIVIDKSNERMQELNAIIGSDSKNDKAKDELKFLKDFVEDLTINKDTPLMEPSAIQVDLLMADAEMNNLIKNYDKRKNIIKGTVKQYDRKNAENELFREAINNAKTLITELEAELAENPGNAPVEERLEILKYIDREYTKSVDKNQEWIDKRDEENRNLADEGEVRVANPEYQKTIDEINKNENEVERWKSIERLNDETLLQINDQIAELDEELVKHPDNEVAIEEKQQLTALKNSITENKKQPLLKSTVLSQLNTDPSPAELFHSYNRQLIEIDRSGDTEIDKEIAKIKLNEQLVTIINSEIDRIGDLKEDFPNNINDLDKRNEHLNQLREDTKLLVSEGRNKVAQLSNLSDTRDPVTVDDLVPNYENELAEIENSDLPEMDKLREENSKHQDLISAIDNRLAAIEIEKENNPAAVSVLDIESNELNAIRKFKVREVARNNGTIESLGGAVATTRSPITITGLAPNYELDLSTIENSSDSEVEKLQKQNETHQNLIASIDQKIEELEAEKGNDPGIDIVIESELVQLNKMKADKELEVRTNTTEIVELGGAESDGGREPITISNLLADYDTNLKEIEDSNESSLVKLASESKLHQELIQAVEAKIDELEVEQRNNPELSTEITAEIAQLNGIKGSKQSQIVSNTTAIKKLEEADLINSREPITVVNLSPSYETDLSAIKNGTLSAEEKLNAESKLHEALMVTIDAKISALETEKDASPLLDSEISKEITQLLSLKAQKLREIDENATQLAELGPDGGNQRTSVTIGTLMRDYDSQISEINAKGGSLTTRLEEKNKLNEKLIEASKARLLELDAERTSNPSQTKAIEADIAAVEAIIQETESTITANAAEIVQVEEAIQNRPQITIGDLVSDYEERMSDTGLEDASDVEKLTAQNELNKELVNAINDKIYGIEEELANDPDHKSIYDDEINKLEALKLAKESEISSNNGILEELEQEEVNIAQITPNSFSSTEAKDAVAAFEEELTEMKDLNDEIGVLEDQLSLAEGEKEQNKLQKQIDKATSVKMKLENEVIEGLADANTAEVNKGVSELSVDREILENINENSGGDYKEVIEAANDNLLAAEQRLNQARDLREEADNEKDPEVVNETLKEAFELEKEAKGLVEKSKRTFKMARTLSAASTKETVITSVPEEVTQRQSTALFDESDELRGMAQNYYDRATELRDSSVKKKHREAVEIEAELNQTKGDQINDQATDVEYRGEQIKAEEDAFLEKQIERIDGVLDANKVDVATSASYKNYIEAKSEGDKKLEEAAALDSEIEELKSKRTRRFKEAISLNSNSENILEEDSELVKTQLRIDELTRTQKRLRDEALRNYDRAKDILNGQTEFEKENLMVLEQRGVKPFEAIEEDASDFKVPTVVESVIFRTTEGRPVYSENARIPIGVITSGLVYKVQVGAFRKPLPQDHFDKFAPISGEALNNGITRYMVGYFAEFAQVNDAKTQVNDLGYGDAFVVAYCNGERVSIREAKAIEAGEIKCDNDGSNSIAGQEGNTGNNNNNDTQGGNDSATNGGNDSNDSIGGNNIVNPNNGNQTDFVDYSETTEFGASTQEERDLISYYTNSPNAAKANQVEIIKGLFYTVQIGVYSKPVQNNALFGIQPLNSQRTESGYIRYSTGIFDSEDAATARKDQVVGIGIKDAFVTAYFDGKRITVEQALQILVRDGADALATGIGTGEITTIETPVGTGVETAVKYFKEGVHYRILIGKYAEAIPGEYATLLLRGDNVFETEVDQEGRTCLISTKIQTFESVMTRLKEFAELGIEDMDIVTYYKYDVIPFEEAQKILNEDEIEELHPYDEIQGMSANKYVYDVNEVKFKIILGEFEENVPEEFISLVTLQESEENINREEGENEIVYITGKINTYEEAETTQLRLLDKGFGRAVIVAYHKDNVISVRKAKEILAE